MNDLKQGSKTSTGNSRRRWHARQALTRFLCRTLRVCFAAGAGGAFSGVVSASEGDVSGTDPASVPQLVIHIQALDSAPWNTFDADDRVALERAVAERFTMETGLSSTAAWCAAELGCGSAAPLALRVELAEPYAGQLQRGFSLTLSGNPRSGDFGKVTLLPLSCGRWSGAEQAFTPKRVEQTVGAGLLEAEEGEEAVDKELLAAHIYDACASQLTSDASDGRVAALTAEQVENIDNSRGGVAVTSGDEPGQPTPHATDAPAASVRGEDEPALVYRNTESTVTLRMGNAGQNR